MDLTFDSIVISLYDHDQEEDYHITLFPDSGDDIYPTGASINEPMQEKISEVRRIIWGG